MDNEPHVQRSSVAKIDVENLIKIRANIASFLCLCGQKYDGHHVKLLDIAPQDHEGAAPYFPKSEISSLDIDPSSGATIIADLCEDNSGRIPECHFDIIVCTEVLEHTLQPFNAVAEIYRLLKPNGCALVSVPFNLRIHGPLPDCWRFTEHGLRALFGQFDLLNLAELPDPTRPLMPLGYTLVARKPGGNSPDGHE